jgi:GWxTD domain-containing protein
MKFIIYVFLLSISGMLISCLTQEKMINKDLSGLYGVDNDRLAYLVKEKSDHIEIFFSVRQPSTALASNDFSDYKIIYKIKENYTTKEAYLTDSLNASHFFSKTPKDLLWTFKIANEYKNKLLILSVSNKRNDITYELDIMLSQKNSLYSNYTMYANEYYYIHKHLSDQDSILFASSSPDQGKKLLYVFHYEDIFFPALPPMATANTIGKKNLTIDTTFAISTEEKILFEKAGMYFIQEDTNSALGMTLLVKNNKFPKLSRANELVEPLIYILTSKEYSDIMKSENPKMAVDNFWLEKGGNKEYSKRLIKSFYENVEYANANFSTFKEGWKTDKGMIHIVMGSPSTVYREENYEEWIYEDFHNFGAISFIFAKRPNIFSDAHYELIRKKDYQKYWYITVDQWRKGIIIR